PVLASMLALPVQNLPALVASLLLGTPILTMLGAIGMALTVGLSRSGLLLSVLILPLYVPVLVFGTGVVDAAQNAMGTSGLLALLGAMLVLALCLSPLAVIAALRIS